MTQGIREFCVWINKLLDKCGSPVPIPHSTIWLLVELKYYFEEKFYCFHISFSLQIVIMGSLQERKQRRMWPKNLSWRALALETSGVGLVKL